MLANVTLELQSPDTWWDDLVQSVSSLPFHYCSCWRAHFLHHSLWGVFAYCSSIIFLRKKKKKLCFISMKAKKLQKKPKNSVWDVLQSSLLSYCNIKSIAPLGSYLGVFPWTTLTNPTFLLRKPSEVGVKRHYFQHFALKSINQHKQSRAKHSSPWDLLHPTAATDTRHTKRLPQEPIKGSECPETSLVQPTTG